MAQVCRFRAAPEIMFKLRELVDANRERLADDYLDGERQDTGRCAMGEVARGLENIEFACGDPESAEGRLLRAGEPRRGCVSDPAAARRGCRNHAVQLSGDGADVDVCRMPLRAAIRSS